MRPKVISQTVAAADQDGIAQSQTPGAGGNLVINGAFASGGVATLDTQRQVLFTFGADETGRVFVVYGTDGFNREISETVAGAAATAVTLLDFKTVTRISIDAASAGAIEVGTNGVAHSTPYLLDSRSRQAPFDVSLSAEFYGTADVTVEYSFHPFHGDVDAHTDTTIRWHAHTGMTGLTAYASGSLESPATAVRLVRNSGTGRVDLIVHNPAAV